MRMDRRHFMAGCAAATAALAGREEARAATVTRSGMFAGVPLRMAAPLGWFSGDLDSQLDEAASYGLAGIEWLGPEGDPEVLREKIEARGLAWTSIVGAGGIGPGHMVQPADHDAVERGFRERVDYAKRMGCARLIGLTGNTRDDATHEEQMGYVAACLRRLAPIAEDNGVTLVMEPLNVRVDHPGFFLTTTDQAVDLMDRVGSPNVQILFDIYHQQITEGNVIRNIRENIDRIGHFHVADNPGRQEPGTGELNYTNIFKAIAETGYDGFVALECGQSQGTTRAALEATRACFD